MKNLDASKLSTSGQNQGAAARAACDTALLAIRDVFANKVVPNAVTGAKATKAVAKVTASYAASAAKGGAAYGVGFVRNFFAAK